MNQAVPSPSKVEEKQLEMHKLKLLVQSLKKKYGEAIGETYNLEAKCRTLNEENSLLLQTKNAISEKFNETLVELQTLQNERERLVDEHAFAIKQATDSMQEIKALTDQHQYLITSLKSYEEESKKAHDDLQAVKLKETQLERVIQFLRKRAEEAHLETNHLTQELSQAQEQMAVLSKELDSSSYEVKSLRNRVEQLESSNSYEKEELKALQDQLVVLSTAYQQEKEEAIKALEANKNLKEALDSENNRYHTLFKEHLFLKDSMMRSVDEAKEELSQAKIFHQNQLEVFKNQEASEKLAYEQQKKTLENEIVLLKEKETQAQEIWAMKGTFDQEKETLSKKIKDLNEQLSLTQADQEEIEQRFKTAQQHLAKKVRETALANEKMEGERVKSLELQSRLNMAEIKISELKNSLEMQEEHQKRSLARESELLKNAEAQVSRLEEKYFDIHEKWREAETEIKELKKIEEKWVEAEKLFSKMGHFASSEPPRPKDPIQTTLPLESPARAPSIPKEEPIKREQATLFEEKKSTPRYKETFL